MTSAGPCGGPVALHSLALLRGRLGWRALLLWSVILLALVTERGKKEMALSSTSRAWAQGTGCTGVWGDTEMLS